MLRCSCTLLLLIAAACGSRAPLPPLPQIETASFSRAIRQAVDAALAEARANPDSASAVGKLGMTLHAHDQRNAAHICYQRASLLEPGKFEWKYYLGLVSDGPAAADAFRSGLRQRDYLAAKIKLGEVLLAAGDSDGAAKALNGIEHPAAWFSYGRATNDPAYYEKALAVFPQYGAALFGLAQHYQRTGRRGEAEKLMARYEMHRLTAPGVEDPLLDEVRALNQGPDRFIREASRAEANGQLMAAVGLHIKALGLDPKLAQAHVNLISLYGRLDDPGNAETHYREAIALQPNSADAHYNYGVLCFKSRRFAEAQAAFTKAVEINPGHADARNNLGVLLERQGKWNDAAAEFRKAIESQPDLRLARFHLGRILANQRKYGEAVEHLERAAAADDAATPTYLYALGATLARAGEVTRAADVLSNAREKAVARGQAQLAAAIAGDLARLKR